MSLALTRQERSFQERVKEFAEKKRLDRLTAKIEAGEFSLGDFLRELGTNRFLGSTRKCVDLPDVTACFCLRLREILVDFRP